MGSTQLEISDEDTMDLTAYRNNEQEKTRIADLMRMVPETVKSVIDIGARDGFLSKELTNYCPSVTALDLEMPVIDHPNVRCLKGDATALQFPDASFDLVFCSEVLEHIPSPALEQACSELGRIADQYVLIGVPYMQDIRHGRTTCYSCGKTNPPWAHVNSFDETRLKLLFPDFEVVRINFVGKGEPGTNNLSAYLLNLAGNPFGTYIQEEPCVHCGMRLKPPPSRNLTQKVLTRVAYTVRRAQIPFTPARGNWIHVLFRKRGVNPEKEKHAPATCGLSAKLGLHPSRSDA